MGLPVFVHVKVNPSAPNADTYALCPTQEARTPVKVVNADIAKAGYAFTLGPDASATAIMHADVPVAEDRPVGVGGPGESGVVVALLAVAPERDTIPWPQA